MEHPMKWFLLFVLLWPLLLIAQKKSLPQTLVFIRVSEKNERAFTLLIPKDWQTEGGVFRVDPTAQGGPSQSVAAKCDFSVKKDAAGSVLARLLPDMLYYDSRFSPAGQMGLFPPGSNYMGMTVIYKMSAVQFLQQIVFPYAHPRAEQIKVLDQQSLPELSRAYQQRMQQALPMIQFSFDAAVLTVYYRENGQEFIEKLVTVIEDYGQTGAGLWGNKETFLVRTPKGEFESWEPVFSIMRNSISLDRQWLAGEIRGQLQRSQIVIDTQREIQRIDREIADHRRKTNAEISNDMFLTLTGQEEYVNPYTHEVETGSNAWQERWVNTAGEVIYTNDVNYNPNHDPALNRGEFKKSAVRQR
jgi:hypothetical protein